MRPIDRVLKTADAAARVVIEPLVHDGAAATCRAAVTVGDGEPVEIDLPPAGAARFVVHWTDGPHRVVVARVGKVVEVAVDGERFAVQPAPPTAVGAVAGSAGPVRSPMPGKVVELPVAVGDIVEAGQTVAVVEAMKLRTSLAAGAAGRVAAVHVTLGDQIAAGDTLVEIELVEIEPVEIETEDDDG
jgi:biotin carboxyl carrier protein